MNIKVKRFLIGLGFISATFIALLFWLDDSIVYYFPKAHKYIDLIEDTIIFISILGGCYLLIPLYNWNLSRKSKNYIFTLKKDSVFVAENLDNKKIYLSPKERRQHIHVIGTTGVGKTEFSLNMMFQDIEQGRGFLLIEHKSDHDLLDQIYAKVKKEGREKDFHLFSLIHPEKSSTYNPLVGDDAAAISERLFRSFDISHEFYKNVQFQWLSHVIQLLTELQEPITFEKLFECICHENKLESYLQRYENKKTTLYTSIHKFLQQTKSSRDENLKGLEVFLSRLATGRISHLLNCENPDISMKEALDHNKIIYFQLPTMKYYESAISLGKLALQDFQSAVSTRQIQRVSDPNEKKRFYSCYLDEFSSLAYPSFSELISKARSANVGLVLSHQAIGDLTKVSDSFSDAVFTNTNIKAIFRCPDPKTAEYFGKAMGTLTTTYDTEQIQAQLVGDPRTGLGTKREVEKFIIHPDEIKKFSLGCGVISIATDYGVNITRCFFPMVSRLRELEIPNRKKIFPIQNKEEKDNGKITQKMHGIDPEKILHQ